LGSVMEFARRSEHKICICTALLQSLSPDQKQQCINVYL
jgi:hypothetical protein